MSRLLLVDDDKEVLEINTKYFKQLGYEVTASSNADDALKEIKKFNPDCIIMDVMMPGTDGFKACTKIKEICDIPLIFLTGRDSEDDKINGLMLGADDYVVKPYSLRELEARIQVHIRRYHMIVSPKKSTNAYDFLLLRIDKANHKVYYKNSENNLLCEQEIQLTNKEYDLLTLLASSPGKVFSFKDIGTAIWGDYLETDRQTIMVTASRLRKKLSLYKGLSNYIETEWSKGYKFINGD